MKSGSLLPSSEVFPRIVMRDDEPGTPLELIMFTPGTLPVRVRNMSGSDFCTTCSAFTSDTAKPNARFSREIPKAVTVTSSNCLLSSDIDASIGPLLPIGCSVVMYPRYLNWSVAAEPGTFSSNRPSASVAVPVVVPFTITLTPGKPSFVLLSSTRPATCRVCAQLRPARVSSKSRLNSNVLFIEL